jgi:hypothetical protein
MTHTLRVAGGWAKVAIPAVWLTLVLFGTAGASTAGAAQFCNGAKIPNASVCHGPFASVGTVDGEFFQTAHGLCLTLQGFSGGYFNIYEWHCGGGFVVYSFGRTNGYPTAENPNSATETFDGEFF